MGIEKIDSFQIIDSLGPDMFFEYQIGYTTFKEKKNPQDEEEILDQFLESVYSKTNSGVRIYAEKRAKEEWPKYSFKWEKNSYESDSLEGKNIYIHFERMNQVSLDAIIISDKN